MLKRRLKSIRKVPKNNPTKTLLFLTTSLTPLILLSCSVDTPTTEYNKQLKLLSNPQVKEVLISQYYDLILANTRYNLTPQEYRQQLQKESSKAFQDLYKYFKIWQDFNLQKDPLFLFKEKQKWDNLSLRSNFKVALVSQLKPAQKLTKLDLVKLLEADSITNIGNTLKSFLLVETYLTSTKLNHQAFLINPQFKEMVEDNQKNANLIAYLLENNPYLNFEFRTSDPLELKMIKFLKIKTLANFNSLFNINKRLESKTTFLPLNLLLPQINNSEGRLFGFKGLVINNLNHSGQLSLDPLTLLIQDEDRAGFTTDLGQTILTLNTLLFSKYLKGKPLLNVAPKVAINISKDKPSLDPKDYVFLGEKSNNLVLKNTNLRYKITKVIPQQNSQVSLIVTITHTKIKHLKYNYSLQLKLDEESPRSYAYATELRLVDSIRPKLVSNQKEILLNLLIRLVPKIKIDKEKAKLTYTLEGTNLLKDELLSTLVLLFLETDNSLLKSVKRYYWREGFMVKSNSAISKELVDSLELS